MMVISKRYSRRRQRRLRSKSEPVPIVVPAVVPAVVRDSDTTARRIFADALGDYDETKPFAKLVS